MAENTIVVDENALNTLKNSLETAGQDYKANLAKLTTLIEQITSGEIEGDEADELLAKYREKEEIFKKVNQTIEEAEEYMGMQSKKFVSLVDEVKAEMK